MNTGFRRRLTSDEDAVPAWAGDELVGTVARIHAGDAFIETRRGAFYFRLVDGPPSVTVGTRVTFMVGTLSTREHPRATRVKVAG